MHVLHIIETLEFGGAEQVTVHLANSLAEHHEITLCLVKHRGELVPRLSRQIKVVYLDLGEGLHLNLPGKLAALIKSSKIDLVHVHNWSLFFETYMGTKLAARCRMLLTVHGPYTVYGEGTKARSKIWLRHQLERFASKSDCVGRIVTVSDAIQKYITADIGIAVEKLLTIHNGVASLEFEPVRFDGEVRLISVGRLAEVKNHRLMIDALARCLQKSPGLSLSLVGDGPQRAALENYVSKLGLQEKVHFLGFRSDIAEQLAAHDIFLLSSNYEGISIALLEAMRLSRPSVATDVGGIGETIENNRSGIIVPAGNAQLYAEAILELAFSADRRLQMGLAAKSHFEANFHEDIVLQKYLLLYEATVSQPNGRLINQDYIR